MYIEFLFWKECPSHDLALQRLRTVLAERRISAAVQIIEVTTEEEAAELHFPGSPTMRIDGGDLFPVPEGPYGLTCRVYHTDDGRVTPLPTTEMIRKTLREVLSTTQNGRND